jgi:hypothetical protein
LPGNAGVQVLGVSGVFILVALRRGMKIILKMRVFRCSVFRSSGIFILEGVLQGHEDYFED